MLKVCEIFKSIQGEGIYVGQPSVFLRFSECPLNCEHCDTKYAKLKSQTYGLSNLVNKVLSYGLPNLVITGGEPFAQDKLFELIEALSTKFRNISIETSGFIFRKHPILEGVNLIISPKLPSMMNNFPFENTVKFLQAFKKVFLKFVVLKQEDVNIMKQFLYKNRDLIKNPVIIQPLCLNSKPYNQTCRNVIDIMLGETELVWDFNIRIIPQIHKFIGIK